MLSIVKILREFMTRVSGMCFDALFFVFNKFS